MFFNFNKKRESFIYDLKSSDADLGAYYAILYRNSLGHYSRKSVTGTATVRATVAGSSNNHNLNSDWSKRRDDLKLVERNREFTLYGFDPKLMGQHAEKMFKSSPKNVCQIDDQLERLIKVVKESKYRDKIALEETLELARQHIDKLTLQDASMFMKIISLSIIRNEALKL